LNVSAILSGAVGVGVLTLVHEAAWHTLPEAPRMDVLGERALSAGVRLAGAEPLTHDKLHAAALGGDVVANTAYYSLVGIGGRDGAAERGALLGLLAGIGAVLLPDPLGLGTRPSRRTPQTAAMTVEWYVLGGVAAGVAYEYLGSGKEPLAKAGAGV
jgi:hypothetical protein